MTVETPSGDDLVEMLAALANPIRLRIMARLARGRDYVSHLARQIGVSRPLLHMHLQRLEAAGLIVGHLELSEDGKAMKFYQVADLDLHLLAATILVGGANGRLQGRDAVADDIDRADPADRRPVAVRRPGPGRAAEDPRPWPRDDRASLGWSRA